jgi:hypothetical protein
VLSNALTSRYRRRVDWGQLGTDFLTSVAAGAVLLGLGYLFVERRLNLREARDRRSQAEEANENMRIAVLRSVHSELESSASHLQICLVALKRGDLPSPGFDVTGWPLVTQVAAFITLSADTITALTHAYNRMTSANAHLERLADFDRGPTATLALLTAAPHVDSSPKTALAFEEFVRWGKELREGLIARLDNLKAHLDQAIDAVEAELRVTPGIPASNRLYLPKDLPAMIGEGGASTALSGQDRSE